MLTDPAKTACGPVMEVDTAPLAFGDEPWQLQPLAEVDTPVLPPLTLLAGMADWRTHLGNLRQAWSWDANDIRWLLLAPRAAVNHRITLPEQGKFNAAEKLNFMMLTATYPLYIVTGIMVWMPGIAFFSWIAHLAMAVMGFPLVAGHIFMAAINPSTRIGLEGMFTGWVDREWAKHHYRIWYREHFEKDEAVVVPGRVR